MVEDVVEAAAGIDEVETIFAVRITDPVVEVAVGIVEAVEVVYKAAVGTAEPV